MKYNTRIDSIRKCTLFSELTEEELTDIANLMDTIKYPEGINIFFEGDQGDKVYFIRSGRIKVVKSSINGDEQILDLLKPGDVFGEVVLFGIDKYPATAITMEEVEVDFLSRTSFKNYFNENPGIAWGMLKVMARKLFKAQQKIENLGLRDTKGRVATMLIEMINQFSISNKKIALDINRQEMANYIGTTRETVSRTLSEFKKKDFIELERNSLYIKNLDGLKDLI